MKRIFLSVLLLLLCFIGKVLAQDSSALEKDGASLKRTWLGLGLGRGTVVRSENANGAGILNLNHLRGRNLFTLRTATAFDGLDGEGGTDLGLLYGRARSWGWGHSSLSAGLALMSDRKDVVLFDESQEADNRTTTTVGIPLQGQIYITLPTGSGWVGAKIGGFANLNPERSFVGATVGLVIGDLR